MIAGAESPSERQRMAADTDGNRRITGNDVAATIPRLFDAGV